MLGIDFVDVWKFHEFMLEWKVPSKGLDENPIRKMHVILVALHTEKRIEKKRRGYRIHTPYK